MKNLSAVALCCLFLCASPSLFALSYQGRFMMGGFVGKEQLNDLGDGSTSNDAASFSSRFYLDVSKFTAYNLSTVTDLREKYDFFDKLSEDNRSLSGQNHFQIRELSVGRKPESDGLFGRTGRFFVRDAGATFVDGLEAGWRTGAIRGSVFGGLNPRRPEDTQVSYHTDSSVYGANFSYQAPTGWDDYLNLSSTLIAQNFKSDLDRFFWAQSATYQPNQSHRLLWTSVIDFVPRFYIQNLWSQYRFDLNPKIAFEAGAMILDLIEYQRQQDIRMRLKASPYREGNAQVEYRVVENNLLTLSTAHGMRTADGKWRHDYRLSDRISPFIDSHFELRSELGYKNQFISTDYYGGIGGSYYSRNWELSLDERFAYENYDDEQNLTPLITQIEASYYLSRAYFFSLSFEHAWDQVAQVYSGFLKIGYRFGNRGTPAIRDVAPRGGRL